MQYEIQVNTTLYIGAPNKKEEYVDDLILALARFGYSPYLTDTGNVCFSIYEEEEITKAHPKLESEKIQNNIL